MNDMQSKGQHMTKYLYLEMDNGETWKIPLSYVVDKYAKYYASDDPLDMNYEDLFEEGMNSLEIAEDWLLGNMDWVDVKDVAILVPKEPKEIDYQDLFLEANVTIVEEEE
jgi:hypothetical protein